MASPVNSTIEQIGMQLDNVNVSFDPIQFDNQAIQKGSLFKHFASLPCPNAYFDQGDVRSPHIGDCCENGRKYFYMGSFRGIMTNVNKSVVYNVPGTVDHSQTYIILPRFYDGTETQMFFSPYDRLVPCCNDDALLTVYWEQHAISETGIDTLTYPAKQVILLIDAQDKQYKENINFILKDGKIVWTSQDRPSRSLYQNQGAVYSIRYMINANYIVQTTIHDVRTIRTADPINGQLTDVKYPQFLLCQKEINFRAKNQSTGPSASLADHFATDSY